jgi:hypothetical protein
MPPVLVASPAGTRVQKQPLRTAESFGNQLFSGSRNLKQNHLAVEYQGRQDQLTAEIEWIQNRTANCTHMIYICVCVCWGALRSGPSGLWIDRNGRMAKAKHLFLAPNILRLIGSHRHLPILVYGSFEQSPKPRKHNPSKTGWEQHSHSGLFDRQHHQVSS